MTTSRTPPSPLAAAVRARLAAPAPAAIATGAGYWALHRAAVILFLFPYTAWVGVPYAWAVYALLCVATCAHLAWWYLVARGRREMSLAWGIFTVIPDSIFICIGMLLTGGALSPAIWIWVPQLGNVAIWLGLGAGALNSLVACGWILLLGATGWTVGDPVTTSPLETAVIAAFMLSLTVTFGGEVGLRQRRAMRSLAEAEARARRDPLTGLGNHGAFYERLEAETRRAGRYSRPLALAVLDLDHFKDVNETHGHAVGDDVLAEVARRLSMLVRQGETLARTGGEEFAWLLPETDAAGAYSAAERARTAIAGRPFPAVGTVTISAGVCDLETAGGSATHLYDLADGALYWAKVQGRNAVYRYSPEVVVELSAGQRAERLERARTLSALRALARAVDGRGPLTREHSERVSEVAARVAEELGWGPEAVTAVREAALLHDLGLIGVPPGQEVLDGMGEGIALAHAGMSAEIARQVLDEDQVAWVRHHQERWAGGGRPDGLAGEAIPAGARVIAVANTWDELTRTRPEGPYSRDEAVREVLRMAGAELWPEAVAALVHLVETGGLVEMREVPGDVAR